MHKQVCIVQHTCIDIHPLRVGKNFLEYAYDNEYPLEKVWCETQVERAQCSYTSTMNSTRAATIIQRAWRARDERMAELRNEYYDANEYYDTNEYYDSYSIYA